MCGDFQDLETGEKHSGGPEGGGGGGGGDEEDGGGGGGDEEDEEEGDGDGDGDGEELEDEEEERRRQEKIAKKEDFMSNGDGAGGGFGGRKGKMGKGGPGGPGDDNEPASYYDLIKTQMADSLARTRRELDLLPIATREAMEGYRPGTYLRLVLKVRWCRA